MTDRGWRNLDVPINALLFVLVLFGVALGPVLVWIAWRAVANGYVGGFVLLPASVAVTVLAFTALGGAAVSVWLDARGRRDGEVQRVAGRARWHASIMAKVGIVGIGGGLATLVVEAVNEMF